jgi:hypothetical protein
MRSLVWLVPLLLLTGCMTWTEECVQQYRLDNDFKKYEACEKKAKYAATPKGRCAAKYPTNAEAYGLCLENAELQDARADARRREILKVNDDYGNWRHDQNQQRQIKTLERENRAHEDADFKRRHHLP